MNRVVIFAGSTIAWVPGILEAYLEAIRARDDISCAAICLVPGQRPGAMGKAKELLAYTTKLLFNIGDRHGLARPVMTTGWDIAKRYNIDLIDAPRGGINHPDFIKMLREQFDPTLGLSIGCLQIWGGDLLRSFRVAVNYHNGYLPHYKGLWPTNWSIYQGEECSGFAFHVMEEGVDTGPILVRGLVPILPVDTPATVERRKTEAATKEVGKVLDGMVRDEIRPIPQTGDGSYFSERTSRPMWTIDNPGELSIDELHRRLRCFAPLQLSIAGFSYPVTSLEPAKHPGESLAFETADGGLLRPRRLQYMPVALYAVVRFLRRLTRQ